MIVSLAFPRDMTVDMIIGRDHYTLETADVNERALREQEAEIQQLSKSAYNRKAPVQQKSHTAPSATCAGSAT